MTKRQAPVEVDVLPAQADGLASAHAGGQHQVVEVREPVVGDVLQELLALLRSPRLGFLGVLWCELDVAFFDLGDPPAARGHLTTALDAARETGDRVLAAAALGHASFVPAAEKNYPAAGDYLRGANAAAAKTDAPILRSWLAAVEAEVSTHAGAQKTALAALDRAVEEIDVPTSGPLPSWFDYYDRSRLDGFRGYSYQAFGNMEAAQSCLEGAVAALPERCAKQRSVVLTDLATVHLKNKEVEEACRTAGTAVQALQRADYATGTHRLREFRSHVEPGKRHRAVRMLDDQMSAI